MVPSATLLWTHHAWNISERALAAQHFILLNKLKVFKKRAHRTRTRSRTLRFRKWLHTIEVRPTYMSCCRPTRTMLRNEPFIIWHDFHRTPLRTCIWRPLMHSASCSDVGFQTTLRPRWRGLPSSSVFCSPLLLGHHSFKFILGLLTIEHLSLKFKFLLFVNRIRCKFIHCCVLASSSAR